MLQEVLYLADIIRSVCVALRCEGVVVDPCGFSEASLGDGVSCSSDAHSQQVHQSEEQRCQCDHHHRLLGLGPVHHRVDEPITPSEKYHDSINGFV